MNTTHRMVEHRTAIGVVTALRAIVDLERLELFIDRGINVSYGDTFKVDGRWRHVVGIYAYVVEPTKVLLGEEVTF